VVTWITYDEKHRTWSSLHKPTGKVTVLYTLIHRLLEIQRQHGDIIGLLLLILSKDPYQPS
jgi:hypothetical protein